MAHVLVIVSRGYNGHEFWTALGVMQDRGHTFEVVSTKTTIYDEKTGRKNTIERVVYDVALDELGRDFNALMLISGHPPDTEAYWHDKHVQQIVGKGADLEIPVAGICVSVPTVRLAAKGKRVSYYPLIASTDLLTRAGAILTTLTLSVDRNLVTAEHQMATQMWAEEFCQVMEGLPPLYSFHDSGYRPGRPMNPKKVSKELQHVRKIVRKSKGKES